MRDFSTRRIPDFWMLSVLILALGCFPPIVSAETQQTSNVSERAKNELAHNPYNLYQTIGQTFWNAEHQLQQRVDPFSTAPSPYKSPLAKSDPLYQKYFQVEQSANEYIKLLDTQNEQSWTLPPALYLGGIAAFTIGDYTSAHKYFSRLLEDHADYKRYSYIGDNYSPDPDFAQPVKPGVSKLLFYCLTNPDRKGAGASSNTAAATNHASDGMASFQQFNKTSQKVLLSQVTFAHWLANRPYRSQRRNFFNEDYGDQPDQLRASVLPKTRQLIEVGWQQLFPAALKKSGAITMRKYLRTLIADDSSLHDIAVPRLVEVDSLIVKSYFAQAKVFLSKKDFAATRAKYKQIIAEYPDSDAAGLAQTELPKVVPVAVNYYKQVADENFHPAAKIGVPQDKALEYYQKMYSEDPKGPKADYALYYWARALGTAGKAKEEVKLLQQHLTKFSHSKMRAEAMYLLGFTYINHGLRDYKRGIPLLLQVATDFPKSAQAPEALWNAAFVLGWNKQYQQAIPLLQQLKEQYPKSLRAKWADEWVAKYRGEF